MQAPSHSAGHYLCHPPLGPSPQLSFLCITVTNHPLPKCWDHGADCRIHSWEMHYYNSNPVLWSSKVLPIDYFSKRYRPHRKWASVCTEKLQCRSLTEVACFVCLCFRSIFTCCCLFKVLNSITCSWNRAYLESQICSKAVCTLPNESVTNKHSLENLAHHECKSQGETSLECKNLWL